MLEFLALFLTVLADYSVSDIAYSIQSFIETGRIEEDSVFWIGSELDNRFDSLR